MARAIPIIKLYDTLIVSIQIALSDQLVHELRENIAADISGANVRGLVIEVSGVDLFDSYIARSIRGIAQMASLMGVRTVLAGLDPAMAITLVEMDVVMEGVESALNLEHALDLLSDRGKQTVAADGSPGLPGDWEPSDADR